MELFLTFSRQRCDMGPFGGVRSGFSPQDMSKSLFFFPAGYATYRSCVRNAYTQLHFSLGTPLFIDIARLLLCNCVCNVCVPGCVKGVPGVM